MKPKFHIDVGRSGSAMDLVSILGLCLWVAVITKKEAIRDLFLRAVKLPTEPRLPFLFSTSFFI